MGTVLDSYLYFVVFTTGLLFFFLFVLLCARFFWEINRSWQKLVAVSCVLARRYSSACQFLPELPSNSKITFENGPCGWFSRRWPSVLFFLFPPEDTLRKTSQKILKHFHDSVSSGIGSLSRSTPSASKEDVKTWTMSPPRSPNPAEIGNLQRKVRHPKKKKNKKKEWGAGGMKNVLLSCLLYSAFLRCRLGLCTGRWNHF